MDKYLVDTSLVQTLDFNMKRVLPNEKHIKVNALIRAIKNIYKYNTKELAKELNIRDHVLERTLTYSKSLYGIDLVKKYNLESLLKKKYKHIYTDYFNNDKVILNEHIIFNILKRFNTYSEVPKKLKIIINKAKKGTYSLSNISNS